MQSLSHLPLTGDGVWGINNDGLGREMNGCSAHTNLNL